MERIGVIIVAGGCGRRCGGSIPKQFALLGGVPVLARTIGSFAKALPGAPIAVVLPAAHIDFWHNLCARFDVAPHAVAAGGAERFDSVRSGLAALPDDLDFIAVHDGVRPLATPKLIRRAAAEAAEFGSAVPVIEAVDSYREAEGDRSHALDRRHLRIVQTPQIFRADLLRDAYRGDCGPECTDDATVVERAGHAVHLCEGERSNLKITAPDDFAVAEALLAAREENAYEQLPLE